MTANTILTSFKRTSVGWIFNNDPVAPATPYIHLSSSFQPLLKGTEASFIPDTRVPRFYTSKNPLFHKSLTQYLEQSKVPPIYISQFLQAIYPLNSCIKEITTQLDHYIQDTYPSPTAAIKATRRAMIEKLDELLTAYKTQNTYATLLEILATSTPTATTLPTTEANQLKALARRIDDIDAFKDDPYRYAQASLSLAVIDRFATALKLSKQTRATGTLIHLLRQHYETGGHTCYPQVRLIKEAAHQTTHPDLKGHRHTFIELSQTSPKFTAIEASEVFIYLSEIYALEQSIADKLLALSNENTDPSPQTTITGLIRSYEQSHDTTLSDQQKDAVSRIFTSTDLVVITGYPGTGKSTITDCIRYIHQCLYQDTLDPERNTILFAAPTGIAANKLNKGKGMTLHRALQVIIDAKGSFQFMRNDTNPFTNRLIIVDEFSMVDLDLAYHLLKAIVPCRTKLVIIGDHNQLPSVGPGDILRHIIASQAVQTIKLTKIFRQQTTNKLNPIVELAKLINKGSNMPSIEQLNNDHIKFINQSKDQEIYKIILKLFKKHKQNCQILFPTKREASVGSINGNNIIANELHPVNYPGRFAPNDKVICTKNCAVVDEEGQVDISASIFNGEIGRAINIEALTNSVLFESATKRLSVNIDNLDHGWCITVNKSQGSEYETVILVLHSSQGIMLNRQVLYTAVTRAKNLLYIIATPDSLHQAITTPAPTRYSLLSSLLVSDS